MTDDPTSQGAPSRGQRRAKVAWHSARVIVILLAAPMVFAVIVAVLMLDRDITAPSWIKTRVSERAALMLGGGNLTFGEITLRVGRDLHPRVRLSDVILTDADGARLAGVREVSGLMSPRGLVFERSALMQEVTLSGTQIALRRNRDGSVAVAFELDTDPAGAAGSFADLQSQIDAVFERPALVALEQINIEGLIINYADARAGRSWTVDDGRVQLDLRDGQTRLSGAAFVLSGGSVTEIALDTSSPRGSPEATISISVTDARAADLATQSAALSWLSALDAPLTADLSTSLNAAGALGPLKVALDVGQGALRAGGSAPMGFDGLSTTLTYQPSLDRIGFENLTVTSDLGSLTGAGQAFLRDVENGLPGALVGQFTLRDIAVNPLGLYPDNVPITDAAVDLRLRLDPFRVEIGQATFSNPEYSLFVAGTLDATPAGWDVSLDTHVDDIGVAQVKALWPESMMPSARGWFDSYVHEGVVHDLNAGVRLRPGALPMLSASYDFDQASTTFMSSMPDMRDMRGTATLINDRFVIALADATIPADQGGAVSLAGSVLQIPDTQAQPTTLQLDLAAESTITAGLSLMDRPPFSLVSKAGRSVTLADGRSYTTGRISWPGISSKLITPDDIRYDLSADLRRVRSDQIIPGRQLVASRARLATTNDALSISGPMTLDGVPVTARWSRGLGPGTQGRSEVVAEVELSPRFLEAFDIALPPGSLTGRGRGDLVLDLQAGRAPTFTLSSDLAGIGLSLPPLGWSKSPGGRGRLAISGSLGTPPQIDRLEVSGGGLEAAGRVTLTEAGGLQSARFDRVQLGGWLNAPITVRGRGAGVPPAVEVGGGSVDFRQAQFGASTGDSGPTEIALDRLQLTDGIALNGFRGSFTGTGGFSGTFSGQVNGGPRIQGTVVPQIGRSAIRLVSDDAGGLASAAGLIENAVGGALDLTLLPSTGEGTFDGTLEVRGLRVRDAPAMAALLNAISVVGLLQQLDGQGLSFDEVDARFRLTPRAVLIQEASAVGPGLGISLDGLYTLATKELDLQGVISPIYLLNGIGSVLTRKGEGLIGFSYTVGGTADAPAVSVNPLSALTPGMFRDIFRRPVPEVTP